jgi:uncharacterized membrane protein YfcA
MNETWLPVLLAAIAFFYASVGHGGASGYLALLAIMGFSSDVTRPTALVLNLFVSAIAFIQFGRAGHFRWSLFWPFAVASVPCAWIGAQIELDPLVYKRILAICLLAAVARLFGLFGKGGDRIQAPAIPLALVIGAALGLVSGMIGIGGGILLSPLLLVFAWSSAKESAAVSAAFIFVNSAAGLVGLRTTALLFTTDHLIWVASAFVGGLLGAYIGAWRFSETRLRHVLGVVLLLASAKLLWA